MSFRTKITNREKYDALLPRAIQIARDELGAINDSAVMRLPDGAVDCMIHNNHIQLSRWTDGIVSFWLGYSKKHNTIAWSGS